MLRDLLEGLCMTRWAESRSRVAVNRLSTTKRASEFYSGKELNSANNHVSLGEDLEIPKRKEALVSPWLYLCETWR